MKRTSFFLKVGQKRRQVTRTLKNGAGSLAQVDAHFVGYDVSQRRFAQARRPEHQQMVKRLAALLGGGNEDFELFAHRLFGQHNRPVLPGEGRGRCFLH